MLYKYSVLPVLIRELHPLSEFSMQQNNSHFEANLWDWKLWRLLELGYIKHTVWPLVKSGTFDSTIDVTTSIIMGKGDQRSQHNEATEWFVPRLRDRRKTTKGLQLGTGKADQSIPYGCGWDVAVWVPLVLSLLLGVFWLTHSNTKQTNVTKKQTDTDQISY